MAVKNSQVADQTLKGAILGAVTYLMSRFNVEPAAQAAFLPLITAALAWASTKVGDPTVASFLCKAEPVVATKKAAAKPAGGK